LTSVTSFPSRYLTTCPYFIDQCVFVCVPVVSGKNRKLCALISPAFHICEQFHRVFKGTPTDMIAGNKLCFRINPLQQVFRGQRGKTPLLSNQHPLCTYFVRIIGFPIFVLFFINVQISSI
jgi:hypothetical protein